MSLPRTKDIPSPYPYVTSDSIVSATTRADSATRNWRRPSVFCKLPELLAGARGFRDMRSDVWLTNAGHRV